MEERQRRFRELEAIEARIAWLTNERDRLHLEDRESNAPLLASEPASEHPSTRQLVLDVEARLRQVEYALMRLTQAVDRNTAICAAPMPLLPETWANEANPSAIPPPKLTTASGHRNVDLSRPKRRSSARRR